MKSPKILTISEMLRADVSANSRSPAEQMAVAMQANHAVMRLAEGLAAVGRMATDYTEGWAPNQGIVPAVFVMVAETAGVLKSLASVADVAIEHVTRETGGAPC